MRAAVLHAYAEPPAYREHPGPVSDPTRALIDVAAAPVAPLDLLCASGASYFGQPPLPYVPGVQGVGRVISSPEVAPGTRVWFATTAGMTPGDGSLAERCVVAPADVVPIDVTVADALVAAIGTSGVAAWMALTWRARLRPGETVIVLGAGGVVGQVALVAARHLGARRVVAVCRSGASAERAERARPHAVVRLDEGGARELTPRLREACGGSADVIIDPVFGESAAAAVHALAEGGRFVNVGAAARDTAEFSSAVLRSRSLALLGYTNVSITPEQRADALRSVLALAAGGELAVDHEILPLAQCTTGWERAAAGGTRVVIAI